ncbi:MAG: hypothetical protein ACFBSG_19465 [Leptolyngbyaceae cyanobacterium]
MSYCSSRSLCLVAVALASFVAAGEGSSAIASGQTTLVASISPSSEQAEADTDDSAQGEIDCTSWSTYRETFPEPALLPAMPLWFQGGCIFGTETREHNRIYILRDGIALDQVFDTAILASAPQADGLVYLPETAIDAPSGVVNELIERGHMMIFQPFDQRACAIASDPRDPGENDATFGYCDFASPHRAYSIATTEDKLTACFGPHCLETYSDVSDEALLALWQPWQASTPNPAVNEIRSQYQTLDLEKLPSDLRQANHWFDIKSILLEEFGRTILEEGEQPTVISDPDYTGGDYSFLNVVTLTNEGLADDSVGGFRYRFEFDAFDGDTMILVWAGMQQYCWRTQEWTAEPCP